MKMEQKECSEKSAIKLQTPGNYPKGSIQHIEHGESLKSRKVWSFTFYWSLLDCIFLCLLVLFFLFLRHTKMSVTWIEIDQRILTPSVSSIIQPFPSTFYDLTVHCGGVNRTFPPPKVVRKPFLSWLVVEQVAACMNTSIHQFAGDTTGKRQSVSCCTKTQLQTVFYFIFCSWCYSVSTGTHLIHSTVIGHYFDEVHPILLIISQW